MGADHAQARSAQHRPNLVHPRPQSAQIGPDTANVGMETTSFGPALIDAWSTSAKIGPGSARHDPTLLRLGRTSTNFDRRGSGGGQSRSDIDRRLPEVSQIRPRLVWDRPTRLGKFWPEFVTVCVEGRLWGLLDNASDASRPKGRSGTPQPAARVAGRIQTRTHSSASPSRVEP